MRCVYLFLYEGFVEELDAIDNGIPMYSEGKPRYKISTHLSARVHRLNPEWNAENPESTDELFYKAMDLVGTEFKERVLEVSTVSSNRKVFVLICLYLTCIIFIKILQKTIFFLGSKYLVAGKRDCAKSYRNEDTGSQIRRNNIAYRTVSLEGSLTIIGRRNGNLWGNKILHIS